VQRVAVEPAARIDARLVLEQQAYAGRIVFAPRSSQQHRLAALGLAARAVLEQEAREPPVAVAAGDAERAPAVAVDRIDRRTGIEQQRRDRRVDAERGAMQRRAPFAIGQARIGAVGQQRHHRFGPPMPAVARRRQQRGERRVRWVELDAGRDQRAQQAQIAEQGRQHRQGALVARARLGQGVRIGAGFEQGERLVDASGARRGVEPHRFAAGFAQVDRARRQRGDVGRELDRGGRRRLAEQLARGELDRQPAGQWREHDGVTGSAPRTQHGRGPQGRPGQRQRAAAEQQ
jgi:hypothetical protein